VTVQRGPDSGRTGMPGRDGGAVYVHLQSANGVQHRTIVISARRARILRSFWSMWGLALVLTLAGSWVYFAMQSTRVPWLTSRIAELDADRLRLDTLQARLVSLQQRYDQVTRMLGAARDTSVDSAGRSGR
jgi:hypothetical protein